MLSSLPMPKNGRDRVALHAHADDDDAAAASARAGGCRRSSPAHRSASKTTSGRALAGPRPRARTPAPPRVDDLVGAHLQRRGPGAPARSRRRRSARCPRRRRAAITARPTGPQPRTSAPSPAPMPGPVHGVQPDRHRLGEGGVPGIEAVGHLEQHRGRQEHALAVAAGDVVAVDDRPNAGHRQQDRDRRDDGAGRRRHRVGADLEHLGRELVAHEDVAVEVERRCRRARRRRPSRSPSASMVAPCWRSAGRSRRSRTPSPRRAPCRTRVRARRRRRARRSRRG